MEYLFNKEKLKTLIEKATDSNLVAISVDFTCDEQNIAYKANISAKAVFRDEVTGIQTNSSLATAVDGCPNPPGCPGETHNLIMKAMNII